LTFHIIRPIARTPIVLVDVHLLLSIQTALARALDIAGCKPEKLWGEYVTRRE
jgi:hypothetical protein